MAKLYIGNAFSLSMVDEGILKVKKISSEDAKKLVEEVRKEGKEIISCVGHQSTAQILSEILGTQIPMNRIAIKLDKGDQLLVLQLKTRLQEGKVLTKEEIENLPMDFYLVEYQ